MESNSHNATGPKSPKSPTTPSRKRRADSMSVDEPTFDKMMKQEEQQEEQRMQMQRQIQQMQRQIERQEQQLRQARQETSKLMCAMDMTRTCERQRCSHFKGPTGNPGTYIYCCAYTAPTMALSVMFLDHYGITSTAQLDQALTAHEIMGPDCKTPLTHVALANGINEVMGHIWSHHRLHGTGIDAWIVDTPQHHLFETELYPGANLLSFYEPAQTQTVHHSFVYVSLADPSTCFVIDSWGAATARRNLEMRRFATAEVGAALLQINTTATDPSEIMKRIFSDPVPGGSCHNKLIVVTLKRSAIKVLIDTQFKVGCSGTGRFGGTKGRRTKSRRTKSRRTNHHKM